MHIHIVIYGRSVWNSNVIHQKIRRAIVRRIRRKKNPFTMEFNHWKSFEIEKFFDVCNFYTQIELADVAAHHLTIGNLLRIDTWWFSFAPCQKPKRFVVVAVVAALWCNVADFYSIIYTIVLFVALAFHRVMKRKCCAVEINQPLRQPTLMACINFISKNETWKNVFIDR